MAFAIRFTDEPDKFPFDDPNTPAAVGESTVGDFREAFVASLFKWDRKEYKAHWINAFSRLTHGADRATLITEYVSPLHSSELEWWPLYRQGELVHTQNHILFYDPPDREFSVDQASSFLRDRRMLNEDGILISEWTTTLCMISAFLAAMT